MESDIDPVEAGHEELRLLVGDVVECEFIITISDQALNS